MLGTLDTVGPIHTPGRPDVLEHRGNIRKVLEQVVGSGIASNSSSRGTM